MRINTFFYSIRQGLKNIFRNKMFSLASVATMAACIFMFGLFYIIVTNFSATVHSIEEGVSVTVFFEHDATDAQIRDIGEKINKRAEVSKNEYVSADEAWKEYKKVYFQGKEELADGFTDNPLANSAHYQVYLNDVSMQDSLVTLSGCSRFVGINSRNQDQFVRYLFLYSGQTVDIFTNCLFVICGTRSDDNQKLVGFSGKYFTDHLVSFFFDPCHLLCHRIIRFDLCRCWQFFQQFNTHNNFSPLIFSGVLWYKHP